MNNNNKKAAQITDTSSGIGHATAPCISRRWIYSLRNRPTHRIDRWC